MRRREELVRCQVVADHLNSIGACGQLLLALGLGVMLPPHANGRGEAEPVKGLLTVLLGGGSGFQQSYTKHYCQAAQPCFQILSSSGMISFWGPKIQACVVGHRWF